MRDLESLRETLFWLQQPGIRSELAEGEREDETGGTLDAEELRVRYGLSPR
jgi:antitoxin YefM